MVADLKIAVSAGESSGDAHASLLARELSRLAPGVSFFGMGGPELERAGARIDLPMEEVSVVGISEVLGRLPRIYSSYRRLCRAIERERPSALVAVDFPDFNFRLIRFAKKLGIPVIYYITPQVWAWRKGRVRFLRENVDLALNILPFEEKFLRDCGVNAHYVGHPLLDRETTVSPRAGFLEENCIGAGKKLVALLPGSRDSEIRAHFPTLVEAAGLLNRVRDDLVFLTPKAPGVSPGMWDRELPPNYRLLRGCFREVLEHSDAGAVASGTASLECALAGLPCVVFYSLNPLTYYLGRKLVKLPFVSLPNIILGREAVMEAIQKDFTSERICAALDEKLGRLPFEKERAAGVKIELSDKLGNYGASKRAAEKVAEFIGRPIRPS